MLRARSRSGGPPPVELAVIPAGGGGRRALPATASVPKPLLEVAGTSLLERNLRIVRHALGIREVLVVTGERGEQIRAAIGDGGHLGLRVRYVATQDPEGGLAAGLASVEQLVDRPFAVLLGDELYLGARHDRLRPPAGDWFCVCGTVDPEDRDHLAANYRVEATPDGGRITAVEEKPDGLGTGALGTGSWLFTPEIFELLRATPTNERTGRVELVDAIGTGIRAGRLAVPVDLGGRYVNVNTVEDLARANRLARAHLLGDATVAVVIPAHAEEATVAATVADLVASPLVDEVLVVDNASPDRTAAVAAAAGARVATVALRGYGDTITWGIDHTDADIIVVTEADHSFHADDLGTLLEHLAEADLVVGTRTAAGLAPGTNMRGVVRWANILAGRLVQLLWWRSRTALTDVGCTYRAVRRSAWVTLRPALRATGPEHAPEVVVEALRAGVRVVEVPVRYHPREGGESKHSGDLRALARTGLRMLWLILRRRAHVRGARR